MFVITGATGNIGSKLTENLLRQEQHVRIIGRNASSTLEQLAQKGAEIFFGQAEDPSSMIQAFAGAKAVFTLTPPCYTSDAFRLFQRQVADAYAAAIEKNNIRYVINLSSVGAHLPEKAGPISGLHDVEERLNGLRDTHILHLRPSFFMENVFFGLELIKTQGIFGSALPPDLPLPMVATQDIAQVATRRFLALDFSGKQTQELHGQRDISQAEVTAIIGKAIGRELTYVQFSFEDTERSLLALGFSSDVARLFIEMYRAFSDGICRPLEVRQASNTTPTSFEDFTKEVFTPVYRAATVAG